MAVRFGRRHGWVIGAYISVTCKSSTAALYLRRCLLGVSKGTASLSVLAECGNQVPSTDPLAD
jgi:hypothetical protein